MSLSLSLRSMELPVWRKPKKVTADDPDTPTYWHFSSFESDARAGKPMLRFPATPLLVNSTLLWIDDEISRQQRTSVSFHNASRPIQTGLESGWKRVQFDASHDLIQPIQQMFRIQIIGEEPFPGKQRDKGLQAVGCIP